MICDAEYFFIYFLAICMSSFQKYLFRSFVHILIGCFFLLLNYLSSFYNLNINLLSYVWFAKIFSHSVGCLFTLMIVYFAVQKLFSLIRSHLSILAFVVLLLVFFSPESLLMLIS